jgi:hypothetical protein
MTANLLDFDLDGLAAFCEQLGEKRFRATQLFRWIHQRGASDFSQMTDLARSLRDKLPSVCHITPLPVISQIALPKRRASFSQSLYSGVFTVGIWPQHLKSLRLITPFAPRPITKSRLSSSEITPMALAPAVLIS